MRKYQNRAELLKESLVEGDVVEFNGKVCRVSIRRGGPLHKLKETVVLMPLPNVVVTEDTEIIINS